MELRAEQEIARRIGIDWKHRGPTAPEVEDKHATWRGQKFRTGSQRWANNGGTRSAWYNTYYPLKRKANDSGNEVDKKRLQQWLAQNPMPEKERRRQERQGRRQGRHGAKLWKWWRRRGQLGGGFRWAAQPLVLRDGLLWAALVLGRWLILGGAAAGAWRRLTFAAALGGYAACSGLRGGYAASLSGLGGGCGGCM